MSDGTQPVSYSTSRDIFDHHGLIVFLLYWVTEIASWLSLSHWLRALPRILPCGFAFDTVSKTVKPWWQDIVFLLFFVLLTPLAVSKAWNPRPETAVYGFVLSIYLLFDTIVYHLRILWFDSLQPGISDARRGVSSHRRILFVAIFSFTQSIVLFPSIYRYVPGLSTENHTKLQERSFSTATLFNLTTPITVVDVIQVSVSLFFLTIMIATMASIAYRRKEFAPGESNG
jgi:hypothetical protein